MGNAASLGIVVSLRTIPANDWKLLQFEYRSADGSAFIGQPVDGGRSDLFRLESDERASGGGVRAGFEGGQMPLQMRLPKFGFTSRKSRFSAEVRLSEIESSGLDEITLKSLREANLVPLQTRKAKIIQSGELKRKVSVDASVGVTKGARAAIEAAGGKVA